MLDRERILVRIPSEEDDLFVKLGEAGVISSRMERTLKEMKGFRNILVHDYAHTDDEIVFQMAKTRLGDFEAFKQEVLRYLSQRQ